MEGLFMPLWGWLHGRMLERCGGTEVRGEVRLACFVRESTHKDLLGAVLAAQVTHLACRPEATLLVAHVLGVRMDRCSLRRAGRRIGLSRHGRFDLDLLAINEVAVELGRRCF